MKSEKSDRTMSCVTDILKCVEELSLATDDAFQNSTLYSIEDDAGLEEIYDDELRGASSETVLTCTTTRSTRPCDM